MRKIFILAAFLVFAFPCFSQQGNTIMVFFPGVPTGTCAFVELSVNSATGDLYNCKNGAWNKVSGGGGGGGSTTFDLIGSGTNTTAAMILGSGSSLNFSGTGTSNASSINGIAISGTPHAGQLPISTSGTTAAWGDPVVSGPDANGAVPTGNPLVGAGWDGTDVRRFLTDSTGVLQINQTGGTVTINTTSPLGGGGGVAFGGTLTLTCSTCALTSTTVNGHALSSNVTVSASDLTTGTLPHAQLPSLVSGDIPANTANTTGTAGGLSANIAESQVTSLTTDLSNRALTSTTVNGHALSSNVTVSASDLTTGTLPHAQLPTLVSGDIPSNTANTSGNATTATGLASYPTLCVGSQFSQGLSSGSNNCASIPTLNQSTTGSAASLSISGQSGLLTFSGLTSSNRAKTVRDAADTVLELGGSYTPTGTWNWTSASVTWPTFNQATTGNAATATALQSAPSQCTSTQAAIGIAASGNAAGCWSPLQNPMTTSGDIIYGASSGTPTRLGANSTGTGQYLYSVSSGVPVWRTPVIGDITGGTSSANYAFTGTDTFTSITPASAGGTNLGTAALPFGTLYLGTAATNNFAVTPGTLAAARTFTMNDPLNNVRMSYVVASGTQALPTASITTATCNSGTASTATNTASTDSIIWDFNSAPTTSNKYGSFLVVYPVPSSNTVTWYVCNPSATTSTPTAMTVNYAVIRTP
jgi:hypothetical protein